MGQEDLLREIESLRSRVAQLEDIEARLEGTERALRESEERFRLLHDHAPIAYQWLDEVGCFLDVNTAWLDTLGYGREEVIGKWFGDFLAPESVDHFRTSFPRFRTTGEMHRVEFLMRKKDGSTIAVAFYGQMGRDQWGRFKQTQWILHDVTELKTSHTALEESEERYRRIVETANEGVWVMDAELRTTFANRRMADMLGYSVDEMLHCRLDSFVFQEDLEDHVTKMAARRQGEDQIYERRLRRKDGETLWTTVSATALKDSEGNFSGSFAMFTDITERKKMEVMLREREGQLQAIFQASPAAIILVNPEGRIEFANQSMGSLFAQKPEELLGTPYVELVHPENRSDSHAKMQSLIFGEIDHVSVERRYVARDDREFLGHISGRRLIGPDGDLTGLVGIITDITDRKKAEEALRESEAHYKYFFDNALVGLFRSRLSDGLFIEMNSKAAELQRRTVEEIVGRVRSADMYRNPDQRKELISILKRHGEVHNFEADLTLQDGSEVTFSISVKAYPDKDYMEGAVIDITDRKKAEEALRRNEAFLAAVWRTSPVGIAVARDRMFRWANQKWIDMHGYRDSQEIVGLSTEAAYASVAEFERTGKLFYEALKTQTVAETAVHCKRKDGSLFHGHMWLTLLDPQNPDEGAIGAIVDITERKKAEEALRLSEERYRSIMDASIMGIYVTQDTVFKYVNPEMARLFGYTPKEMEDILGPPDVVTPEEREIVRRSVKKRPGGGTGKPYEFTGLRKDGSTFAGLVWPTRILFQGRPAVAGTCMDITEQKRLERQLVHSQKMEAVGTLAGGIAHDVNNLLQVMLGQADMLLFRADLDEKSTQSVKALRRAARNGADLVKRILAFSRQTETVMRPVNLNDEVRRLQGLLRRTIPRMISIEMDLESSLWMTSGDPSQLEQVVLNLAVNAKDSMPEGGRLVFATRNVTLRPEYCRVHPEVKPGKYVLMTASDTGQGIDKGTLDRIFEPFFTTKQPGEGTGLGLSMVFGIVKSHGGHITCYSEVGVGTTFKIYFPVAEIDLPTAVADTVEMPVGGTETLLLVDDDEAVRTLGSEMLELAGYTVLTVENGREALDVYEQQGADISLVILDLVMPGMSGRKCLEELLRMDSKARILITSGYSADGPAEVAVEDGASGFIGKPFDLKDILRAVRKCLDTPVEKP